MKIGEEQKYSVQRLIANTLINNSYGLANGHLCNDAHLVLVRGVWVLFLVYQIGCRDAIAATFIENCCHLCKRFATASTFTQVAV